MSIKFVCSCGKRLRAREEMAARRSVCPRCGAPVGIPSLQPTHPGTAANPLTPAERLRRRPPTPADASPIEEAAAPPRAGRPASAPEPPARDTESTAADRPPRRLLNAGLVRLVLPRRHRFVIPYRRQLETHWYQCLQYPFASLPLLLGLAFALTVLTGGTALVLPEVLDAPPQPPWLLLLYLPGLVAPLVIVGNPCAWLLSVLTSAAAGEVKHVDWPGGNLRLALAGVAIWLGCFLAGPVVLAAAAVLYAIRCGDPDLWDWLILAELGIGTVGYWLLALLAVSRGSGLQDANPVRVAELAHRLGYRAVVAVLGAAVLVLSHGTALLVALQELHREPGLGWLWLAGCWSGSLFGAVFLFRLLGVWCHRAQV
jgi:hypothetical protein